jgi:hypothetical protein
MSAAANLVQDANGRSCRRNPRHEPVVRAVWCEDIKLTPTGAAPSIAGQVNDFFVLAITVEVNKGVRKSLRSVDHASDLANADLNEFLQIRCPRVRCAYSSRTRLRHFRLLRPHRSDCNHADTERPHEPRNVKHMPLGAVKIFGCGVTGMRVNGRSDSLYSVGHKNL